MVDLREPRSDHAHTPESSPDHAHDIYTLANIITILRLILVPIFFAVLMSGRNDTVAFILFVVAASTDWVDGQIARRTGTVTEIGKAIDPIVDRLLIAAGVLGVYLEGRVPLWILAVLILRDVFLGVGVLFLARRRVAAPPVNMLGKITTALLLIGFSGLILNQPLVPGLGVVESPALPGWGSSPAPLGIWFLYVGILTSLATAAIYTARGLHALRLKKAEDTAAISPTDQEATR